MSLETAAAAGGLKQQPASDVTVVSLSSTSSATSRPRVSRTPLNLHYMRFTRAIRIAICPRLNLTMSAMIILTIKIGSVYSTSNNNVSASNLKVAATRGLTRAHPQNQLRKGKKHARIHAPLHRRGLIHQQHHEEGIKSSSPTDSLPPLSSAFSPSSTATATTTATTTLTKRRLQAFLYPAHVAHDPFLSLDQLRFRQFVLLASSNTDTTTAVSTTITTGNSNSKSQDENEQQPNYPKKDIVTLPIPSSNSVSTTITKRSSTAWAHPTDRPRSRNKESLDHQGHLGRGCHHCIEIPCCCRERSSITTAANEIHARQRTSSLLPLTATNPFCTITEEDEELKMPLSLRATTIENQTITIPADSPSQSPLILEPALSTITDASSTSTSSSSTIIAGENGNKGRMWYRKMSQWPPSEFVDPFAAGPIVVVASSSSSNANVGDVRGGHHVKKKNVPACVERVEVKLLDGKIVDAVLGALPPGPKSNVPLPPYLRGTRFDFDFFESRSE
ncbi:uncharacterized protein EI90DRAFT_3117568 [Cantharellus anzutake]|uniref:uncharacterized protein n=1 Tax=Cantharellus anzutake TaxID=1750568 RepID=UPI001908A6E2|nr:uncharacterized protein EI90DRAFT_3117568 [Cantharellus anzutake]KAF8339807.1 hypothetical protein EI90DRAFT_3117568 [Cantharellus anzutake]